MTDSIYSPSYLNLSPEVQKEKVEILYGMLRMSCRLCPRACQVDRTEGQEGFCRTLDEPVVSGWGPHFGEESPLSGRRGSGTIFFGNCNLGCVYCQNWTISHLGEGRRVTTGELASIMLGLQSGGAHNINLVSPTHQVPMIVEALFKASRKGLRLPVVYNSGGYESIETLQALDGIVDIYMPDFKYFDQQTAKRLSGVSGYPAIAQAALQEMHRQCGELVIDKDGVARRGLLIRHLVLPGGLSGTEGLAGFLASEISKNTYLNIMDQYHPCHRARNFPPLDRRPLKEELRLAVRVARSAGLNRLDGFD